MRLSTRLLATSSLALALLSAPRAALGQSKPATAKPPAKVAAQAEPAEAPGTITKWKTIRTRWVELPVPEGWKLSRKCIDGDDARRIMWVYESPRRNFKLWLTVKNDKPGVPFKTLANRYWRHVHHRTNARDWQTLQEQLDVADGKELFVAVASAEIRRFEKVHAYLVTGLFRRLKRVKKTVSASIAAEGAVLDELMPLMASLMDRIKIKDGKVAPAKPGARPGARTAPAKAPAPVKKAR